MATADRRQIRFRQDSGPHGVVDIVVDVGHDVCDASDLPLNRARTMLGRRAYGQSVLAFGVARDAVAHFPRQVEPLPPVLEHIDNPETLLVVTETAGREPVDDALPCMPERRMAQVVTERDGFRQLLVQAQAPWRCFERSATPRACA